MAEGVRRRYGVLGPATSTLKATAPPAIHGNSKHKDAQAQRGEHLSSVALSAAMTCASWPFPELLLWERCDGPVSQPARLSPLLSPHAPDLPAGFCEASKRGPS